MKKMNQNDMLIQMASCLFSDAKATVHVPLGSDKESLIDLSDKTPCAISFDANSFGKLNKDQKKDSPKIKPDDFLPKKKPKYAIGFYSKRNEQSLAKVMSGSHKFCSDKMVLEVSSRDLGKRIGALRKAREDLVESRSIVAVVSLDSMTNIILLDMIENHDEILFIDAESKDGILKAKDILEMIKKPSETYSNAKLVNIDSLLEDKNTELSVSKHIISKEELELNDFYERQESKDGIAVTNLKKLKKREELKMEVIRTPPIPQLLPKVESNEQKSIREKDGHKVSIVLTGDASSNTPFLIDELKKETFIDVERLEEYYFLRPNDVLLVIRGQHLGKVHYIHDLFEGSMIIACSDIAILRFPNPDDAGVVYSYLTGTEFGRKEVQKFIRDDMLPSLGSSDIDGIRIPMLEEQKLLKKVKDHIAQERALFSKILDERESLVSNLKKVVSIWK